jgi:hypothetical protein
VVDGPLGEVAGAMSGDLLHGLGYLGGFADGSGHQGEKRGGEIRVHELGQLPEDRGRVEVVDEQRAAEGVTDGINLLALGE